MGAVRSRVLHSSLVHKGAKLRKAHGGQWIAGISTVTIHPLSPTGRLAGTVFGRPSNNG